MRRAGGDSRAAGTAARRSCGFVYYDLWLTVAGLALAAAIVVPAVVRAVQNRATRRAEIAALRGIAALELAQYSRAHSYLDSLPPVLPPGTRLVGLSGDSTGWSVAITTDSLRRSPVSCGVFEGPASFAPSPAATVPGRIVCW